MASETQQPAVVLPRDWVKRGSDLRQQLEADIAVTDESWQSLGLNAKQEVLYRLWKTAFELSNFGVDDAGDGPAPASRDTGLARQSRSMLLRAPPLQSAIGMLFSLQLNFFVHDGVFRAQQKALMDALHESCKRGLPFAEQRKAMEDAQVQATARSKQSELLADACSWTLQGDHGDLAAGHRVNLNESWPAFFARFFHEFNHCFSSMLAKTLCLAVLGNPFGDDLFARMCRADMLMLLHLTGASEEVKQSLFADDADRISHVFESKDGKYVHFVLLNDPSVDDAERAIGQAIHYPCSLVVYGGHANLEGEILLDRGVKLTELMSGVLRLPEGMEGGASGYLILNCCYSHKVLESIAGNPVDFPAGTQKDGVRIYATTRSDTPELPAGGIWQVLAGDTEGCWGGDIFRKLTGLEFPKEIHADLLEEMGLRSKEEFRMRKPDVPVTDIEDGIYMFKAGQGDTYLIKSGDDVVIFDTGHFNSFVNYAWPFIVDHVQRISVMVASHHDWDHLSGLHQLCAHNQVNDPDQHPHLGEVWMNVKEPEPTAAEPVVEGRTVLETVAQLHRVLKHTLSIATHLTAQRPGVLKSTIHSGMNRFKLGDDGFISVLWPTRDEQERILNSSDSKLINDNSIVLLIIFPNNGICGILCADSSAQVMLGCEFKDKLKAELERAERASLNFISLPHHGSKVSLPEERVKDFVQTFNVDNVFISTNAKAHGHPSAEGAIKTYYKQGKRLFVPYEETKKAVAKICEPANPDRIVAPSEGVPYVFLAAVSEPANVEQGIDTDEETKK